VSRFRQLLGRADGLLGRLRDQLTPGQRWTLALGLLLTLAILLFGLPDHVVVSGG
jgi:hypothetical protein